MAKMKLFISRWHWLMHQKPELTRSSVLDVSCLSAQYQESRIWTSNFGVTNAKSPQWNTSSYSWASGLCYAQDIAIDAMMHRRTLQLTDTATDPFTL
jgi:hypothetical protein